MNSITACLAASLVAKLLRWYISFFSVAKNDSATALSRQLPVRLQERRTWLPLAHLASLRLVYCAPLSVLSRSRLNGDYAEKNAKPRNWTKAQFDLLAAWPGIGLAFPLNLFLRIHPMRRKR